MSLQDLYLTVNPVGYGLDVGADKWRSMVTGTKEVHYGSSKDAVSLESVLEAEFRRLGYVPGVLALALPGAFKDGRLEFTNLDWPSVDPDELTEHLRVSVHIINDLQAAHFGCPCVPRDKLTLLKKGVEQPGRNTAVLTLSSGVNWSTGPAREAGHSRLATPSIGRVSEYVAYVSRHVRGGSASIENLLSGDQGIRWAAAFRMNLGTSGLSQISDRCGPQMTRGALDGDPFWVGVAQLYGETLGYLLNTIVVGELVGELFIQGSVLNGTPGFAEWLFKNTGLVENLISEGMEKSFVAEEVTIYGVPNEVPLGAIGAERYAWSWLKER